MFALCAILSCILITLFNFQKLERGEIPDGTEEASDGMDHISSFPKKIAIMVKYLLLLCHIALYIVIARGSL